MAFEVPTIGSPNSTQDPKIKSAVEGLNSFAGTYRTLLSSSQTLRIDIGAFTYLVANTSGVPVVSGENISTAGEAKGFAVPYFYFDDADYLVSGLTQKLRIRAQMMVNATKPTIKFTVGLYPITVAGAADVLSVTLGTVVSGSTVEINEPAASTITSGTGSDFTIPSDGAYMLGVVTSGTLTNNSAVYLSAQLQTRST